MTTGQGLTIRQDLDNLLHLFLESDFKNTVRFINHQCLDVLEDETFGVLKSAPNLLS
jgi:hypothetical protein